MYFLFLGSVIKYSRISSSTPFVVNQKSLTELIELIPNNSREKIKKELAIDSDFTNHFLSYLNNNKIEFDYLMQETEILSSAFYSSYITNICDEKLKVTFLLNSCNKINYNEWEKILKKNPSLITELGNTIKNKYPKEFLNDKQVSYISNFYISNNEPLVIGNELKYKSLTNEIIENSLRWMLPNVIEIISDNDDRDLALKRYINLSKDMNDIVDAKKLYPEMTSYASKKSSEFVSSISDKKIYLKIFPKGFHSEKYNQEIYAYEQELEKQRQQRIQRRIERRNNFLFVDQLKQMFHDEVEPLFILSKLKQISNEYPVDLSEIQLNILKHVRFVTQTKTAQNSQSGGIASFMSGGISGALSHKSNVGSVYENELIWVINPNQSVGGFDDYISPIDNPKTLVSNIFYEIENNRYERWSRRIMHSNFGEYNKPVKVPAYARSRGESLSSGWYIMGALTGAYVTYTKGLQYLGSKGYLSSESSSSGYSNESTTSNRNNSNESTSSYSREKIDKSNNSNNNNEPQIIKDGTKKYGQYESVLYKIICPDGYTNYLYYDEQSKCWHKRSSATCDYLTPNTKEGLRRAARKLCGNN